MKELMTLYVEELRQERERVRVETENLNKSKDGYEKTSLKGLVVYNTLGRIIDELTEITGACDD